VLRATLEQTYDRDTAQGMVSQSLCPPDEERDRNIAGMEAYQNDDSGGADGGRGTAIANDDPRSEYTYGEFPFGSFDSLVDRALDFVQYDDHDEVQQRTMVDLGSGCGRLVFYAALTRGGAMGEDGSAVSEEEERRTNIWNVHGVEIGTQLHSLAANSLRRGIEYGWFRQRSTSLDESSESTEEEEDGGGDGGSEIAFHNGNALPIEDPYYTRTNAQQSGSSDDDDDHSSIQSLLSRTDLLFAYSTVWETDPIRPFDPELGAMVLSSKWSQTLASSCRNGCVAITTDRALDPKDGWRLMERIDVENPSVWGSVGYISVLEK